MRDLPRRVHRLLLMLFQITGIPKGWEERGGMTTQTISKRRISGAMREKGSTRMDG